MSGKVACGVPASVAALVFQKGRAGGPEGTQQADAFRRNSQKQQAIGSFNHDQVMSWPDRLPGKQPDPIGGGAFGGQAAEFF